MRIQIKKIAPKLLASGDNAARTSAVCDLPEGKEFVTDHFFGAIAFFREVSDMRDQIPSDLVSYTSGTSSLAPVPV